MLTPDEIKAMRERLAKTTEGPWYMAGKWTVLSERNSGDMICNLSMQAEHEANGDFIAHARTDIPKLLLDREELQAEIDSIRRDKERLQTFVTLVDRVIVSNFVKGFDYNELVNFITKEKLGHLSERFAAIAQKRKGEK